MDGLSLAESIPSSNVTVIDMENGEFLVKSQSRLEEKKMYKVMFGTKQPSCECFDWERQRLPCKHFFAVFQHVPSWSFDRLPKEYRDSPFFSVDRDVLLAGEKEEDDGIADGKVVDSPPCVHDEVHDLQKQSSQFENIPQSTLRPRTHAAKCRELLGQIKNLTYTAEAWEVGGSLRQVQEKLEECLDLLQKTAPKEDGIILEAPLLKSTMKKNSRRMKKKKVDYKRLPVSQKKNPFTGRVGERANNMKRGYNVSLNDIERQPAKQPKLAHIKNANSSAEAQVNINRSVNVNNSNGSNSNANQTVKASTPYTPNTTTCITSTANANTISSINTTSSTTGTANTCIILTVNATTNTNLAQQNKKDDEVEFVKTSHRSATKAVPECRDRRPLFVQEVSVMCEYRMPREESDSKSPSRCVKCRSCKEFFHRKCISTIILEDSSAN
ncbi:hypothetical protein pdam_00024333 [Pocillopora damicornis]|uniref:SWIM-type domain-containing protein n=1 Tax=Pocillopora damicornis TaxID=46731 RepID=A0A3M6T574_POCDA|nr:hypothetical protein pdam_00024333 [Pocillopora damicornis]